MRRARQVNICCIQTSQTTFIFLSLCSSNRLFHSFLIRNVFIVLVCPHSAFHSRVSTNLFSECEKKNQPNFAFSFILCFVSSLYSWDARGAKGIQLTRFDICIWCDVSEVDGCDGEMRPLSKIFGQKKEIRVATKRL